MPRIAGICYLLTFVSLPTLALYSPVRDPDYAGSGNTVALGGVLEMIVGLACIGTAVALYPVLKPHGERRALGFVAARILEATLIFVGVASLLTIVQLHRSDAASAVAGQTLVAFYDSTFLVSQSLIPAVNAVLLGTLLYQTRLVPRALPLLGLIGAPLLVLADLGVLFGTWDRLGPLPAVAALPIAAWELSLGIYLITRGFRPIPTPAETALTR